MEYGTARRPSPDRGKLGCSNSTERKAISSGPLGCCLSWSSETDVQQEGRRDVDPCTWSIIVTAAAVVVLPLVLLMVTVMLLAVASLVIPARRQRYLLAVLDRLVKIATALRGSSK